MPLILLYCPTISEVDVGGMTVEVRPCQIPTVYITCYR